MGRRSSLHEDFVRVKTLMGLERFEVENFLNLKEILTLLLAQKSLKSKITSVRLKAYP